MRGWGNLATEGLQARAIHFLSVRVHAVLQDAAAFLMLSTSLYFNVGSEKFFIGYKDNETRNKLSGLERLANRFTETLFSSKPVCF